MSLSGGGRGAGEGGGGSSPTRRKPAPMHQNPSQTRPKLAPRHHNPSQTRPKAAESVPRQHNPSQGSTTRPSRTRPNEPVPTVYRLDRSSSGEVCPHVSLLPVIIIYCTQPKTRPKLVPNPSQSASSSRRRSSRRRSSSRRSRRS